MLILNKEILDVKQIYFAMFIENFYIREAELVYVAGIDAFLAIVQTQSLKKAAEFLHLTQATVSYRLKILEQEMGAILVERGKGIQKIALTPFGENFVTIAERWSMLKRIPEMNSCIFYPSKSLDF